MLKPRNNIMSAIVLGPMKLSRRGKVFKKDTQTQKTQSLEDTQEDQHIEPATGG